MPNHKLSRNILLTCGFISLLSALIPWKNKDIIGQILFGIQSFIFFIGSYLQQKVVVKAKNEDKRNSV